MKSFIPRQELAKRSDISPVSIMILFHYIYQAVSFSILQGRIILTGRSSSFFTGSVSLERK